MKRVKRRTNLGEDDNDLSLSAFLVLSDEELLQPRTPEAQRIPRVNYLEQHIRLLERSLQRRQVRIEQQRGSLSVLVLDLHSTLHLLVIIVVRSGNRLGLARPDTQTRDDVDAESVLVVFVSVRVGVEVGLLFRSSVEGLLLRSDSELLLLVL
jgi:hypothetical protein